MILITFGLLYWILRGTSLSEILGYLRRAHLGPLVAAVVVATVTFPLRAIRWHYLLRRENGDPVAPVRALARDGHGIHGQQHAAPPAG